MIRFRCEASGLVVAPNPDGRTCERCGKKHLGQFVWLELDSLANTFHEPGTLPFGAISQGLFPFGRRCAMKANSRMKRTR